MSRRDFFIAFLLYFISAEIMFTAFTMSLNIGFWLFGQPVLVLVAAGIAALTGIAGGRDR